MGFDAFILQHCVSSPDGSEDPNYNIEGIRLLLAYHPLQPGLSQYIWHRGPWERHLSISHTRDDLLELQERGCVRDRN